VVSQNNCEVGFRPANLTAKGAFFKGLGSSTHIILNNIDVDTGLIEALEEGIPTGLVLQVTSSGD